MIQMKKVFISTGSFGRDDRKPLEVLSSAGLAISVNPFGRKLKEEEAAEYLKDADYLIAGTEILSRKVLACSKKLRIISRCGVGVDNIDLQAAKELGIAVYSTADSPTVAVAELTIALILDLLRLITPMSCALKSGNWGKRMGHLLNGKNVGIIGFGRIGQKVAHLSIPFGVNIAYYDISEKKTDLPGLFKTLPDILSWADIITLHCSPSLRNDKNLIGTKELNRMKKGAWLINVSRGGVVDEKALYHSLKNGDLAGAALDVYSEEPYSGPLRELDNIILTPHIGSYAKEARIKMEIEAVNNLLNGIKILKAHKNKGIKRLKKQGAKK